MPHLAARREFAWLVGDIIDFAYPEGRFDYVFHFATASSAEVGAGGTVAIIRTLRGTERVLQFSATGRVKRLLFASSGAVYGPQPADLCQIPEDCCMAPEPVDSVSTYGNMKRIGERLCLDSGIDCVISRGFAFVGPYLPLTGKFAVGSFLRDAVKGGPISIQGDGTQVRSYLYAADLAVWLLSILALGGSGKAYNVGSDAPISLRELAECIAQRVPGRCPVELKGDSSDAGHRYIPDISLACRELGLQVSVGLEDAIERSLSFAFDTCGRSVSENGAVQGSTA